MSLNSLPDEIIAKISKKMPHSDRLNLMSTSKRNGRIGQKYRLQYKYGSNLTLGICNTTHQRRSDGNTVLLRVKNGNAIIEDKNACLEDILPSMKQFPSLKILQLSGMRINSNLVRDIETYKGKITIIEINNGCCFDLTKTNFLKLTKCCARLHVENIEFAAQNRSLDENDRFTNKDLLSDKGIKSIVSKLFVFMPYLAVKLRGDNAADGSLLTDRLLLEVISKHWPFRFNLSFCKTSFTLDGVITFIKLAESERSRITYQLGSFVVESKTDAVRMLNEMATELNYVLFVFDEEYDILDDLCKQCSVYIYEPNMPPFENTRFIFEILHSY